MPLKNDWDTGDQFTADDANDVADAVNSAYVKPGDGIPKADLVSAVQVSLGKADTAVQAVDAATISDSTSTGRAVLKATDAAAARTAIGVAYGTTSGTVAQGNDSRFSPSAAAISDSTAVGRSLLTATDAASARSAIGVAYGASGGTVCQGNDSRVVGAEQVSNKGASNGYASLDSSGKVPVTQLPTGFSRSITTITADTTLGSTAGTDYVVLSNIIDTDAASCVAMLHMDGSSGGGALTDGASGASSWVYVNGALSTAQKKFGAASYTGGLFYASNNASNFAFGTSDFSVELWLRTPSSTNNNSCVFDFRNDGVHSDARPWLYITSNRLRYHVSGADRITGGTTLSANTWYHIALCRVSGVTKLYLGGVQEGASWTDSTSYTSSATRPIFLRNSADVNGGYYSACVDEVRILKGVSGYSAAFTPYSVAFTDDGGVDGRSVITLPTASGNSNQYTILNINARAVKVVGTGGQTIDGASFVMVAAGTAGVFISDGSSAWYGV